MEKWKKTYIAFQGIENVNDQQTHSRLFGRYLGVREHNAGSRRSCLGQSFAGAESAIFTTAEISLETEFKMCVPGTQQFHC